MIDIWHGALWDKLKSLKLKQSSLTSTIQHEKLGTHLKSGASQFSVCKHQRSIFQAEFLTAILFVIALTQPPLELQRIKLDYLLGKKRQVEPSTFLDYRKMYSANGTEIDILVNTVKECTKTSIWALELTSVLPLPWKRVKGEVERNRLRWWN